MLDADGRLTQLYGGVQHVDYGYNQAGLDNYSLYPGGFAYGVKTLSGATTSFIPQGGLISAGLATILGRFQPSKER